MTKQYICRMLVAVTWIMTNGLTVGQTTSAVQTQGATGQQPTAVVIPPAQDDHPKFYTITATLREVYDDNINTSKTDQISSLNTDISPSLIINYPMENTEFTARYTFGLEYYSNQSGNPINTSHEFVAEVKHAFSDRFNLDAAESFRYYTEPGLFDGSGGTYYRNGGYYDNNFNLALTSQWTPLLSTSTSFTNSVIRYDDATVSIEQDEMENTVGETLSFAIYPKFSVTLGGIVDNVSYDHIARGYTSYSATTGINWQALPNLNFSASGGGSVTEADQQSTDTISPYFDLSLSWQIGKRSSLSFSYTHSISPTDVYVSEGQISDHLSTTLHYDISSYLSSYVGLALNYADYTQSLITPGTVSSFTEEDYQVTAGLSYHVNTHFDLETGYTFSGVSSGLNYRDYTRNEVYVGVRGTY